MKGVVFNLLEEAVTNEFGAEVWDDLLVEAGVTGAYTSLGSYPDDEMLALFDAAGARFGKPAKEMMRWFGERAMPSLRERYPEMFVAHKTSRTFVFSVNSFIHPEVRKLYAGATCPVFHFRERSDGVVSMIYASPRKMCDLAHGFVKGAGGLFAEEIDITHTSCMHDGDQTCVMELRWVR